MSHLSIQLTLLQCPSSSQGRITATVPSWDCQWHRQTDCRRCTVQLQEFSPQCDLYHHICNFRSCLLAFFAVDFLVKTALLVLMETATTVMVWNQIFRKCCPQTRGNFQRASGKFKASRAVRILKINSFSADAYWLKSHLSSESWHSPPLFSFQLLLLPLPNLSDIWQKK